jgi:hypothetical protein
MISELSLGGCSRPESSLAEEAAGGKLGLAEVLVGHHLDPRRAGDHRAEPPAGDRAVEAEHGDAVLERAGYLVADAQAYSHLGHDRIGLGEPGEVAVVDLPVAQCRFTPGAQGLVGDVFGEHDRAFAEPGRQLGRSRPPRGHH